MPVRRRAPMPPPPPAAGWRRSAALVAVALAALVALVPRAGAAEDAGVELVRSAAPPLTVRGRAAVSLTILPRAGTRLAADAPLLVRLDGDGVTPARPLLRREDAVDPRAEAPRFEIGFVAARAGSARLTAHLVLYVCRDDAGHRGDGARCRPLETDATWSLDIAGE